MKAWLKVRLLALGWAPVEAAVDDPEPGAGTDAPDLEVEISRLNGALAEQASYRRQDASELMTLFNVLHTPPVHIDGPVLHRLSRIAGTTLLEAAFILRCLDQSKTVEGDWCEYGVAHGRTSALLLQVMLQQPLRRTLWLYDSFEGLPVPHDKDVMLHDIFGKGSMAAYAGSISFPEPIVTAELLSVTADVSRFKINKGWITAASLPECSPDRVAFAYLDMDFYQSTYDVLKFLVDRMPRHGMVVLDDYGFFSDGVRIAAGEVMTECPGAFKLDHPYASKFAVLTRQ